MEKIYCDNERVFVSKSNYHNPNTFNALDAGIVFLIFLAVMEAAGNLLLPVIDFLYGLGVDYGVLICAEVIISQGAIFLIAFVYSSVRHVKVLSGGGFSYKWDTINVLFGILLALSLYFIFSPLHLEFVDDWTRFIYLTDYTTYSQKYDLSGLDINGTVLIIYSYVLVPVLPAICEEALFRGVIMRGLKQFGNAFAVVCSALIFAVMHGSVDQFILQFIIGLAISGAVMITGNFLVGSLMHAAYNFSTTVFSIVPSVLAEVLPSSEYLYQAFAIMISIVAVTVAIFYFAKMALNAYKRKLLGKPTRTNPYETTKYCVLRKVGDDSSCYAVKATELDGEFYKDAQDLTYYDGKKFVNFNRQSNVKVSTVVLIVAVSIGIVLEIFAGLA